jgi:hypothetical protein
MKRLAWDKRVILFGLFINKEEKKSFPTSKLGKRRFQNVERRVGPTLQRLRRRRCRRSNLFRKPDRFSISPSTEAHMGTVLYNFFFWLGKIS